MAAKKRRRKRKKRTEASKLFVFCLLCCNCSTDIISKQDRDCSCKSKHTCHAVRSRL